MFLVDVVSKSSLPQIICAFFGLAQIKYIYIVFICILYGLVLLHDV